MQYGNVFYIKHFLLDYFTSSSPEDMQISFSTITGDNSVSTVTGYWLDGHGLIPSRRKRFFCTPQCPDWF
jgi:hypothetical protein